MILASILERRPSNPPPAVRLLYALAGSRAPLGRPVWKPFLNFRATVLRYRTRPVPVTFLRLAFSDQLSVSSCQNFSSPVWAVWHARLLSTRHGIEHARKHFRLVGQRTLANLSSRVSARSAGVLLVVHGAASKCLSRSNQPSCSSSRRAVLKFLLPNLDRPSPRSSFLRDQTYPHRRQMPCVLVWLQRNISIGGTVRIPSNL